jgi:hypothetical protein
MSAEEVVVERPNVVMLDQTVETPKVEETKDEPKAEVQQETQEEVRDDKTDEGQERDESGKFKPKNATQARIDELTRQKHEAAREAAYWRGLAESQRAAKETTQDRPTGKPSADSYENHEDFVEALTDWKLEQKLAEHDSRQQERAKASTWQERATAARAEMPDFEEVMASSTAPMSHAMAEAIKESEMGPKVAYHLAMHPEEAARLANMSPTSAIREIGKIEATLSAAKAAPAPAPRVTTAPKPADPIGSGRSTAGDPGKMSQADYEEWRKTQLKQR